MNWLVLVRTTGEGHYDLVITMNGVLTGLVSITASCGLVEPWAAVVTGAIGGVLYLVGNYALIKCRLDDAVDAIPVHLVGGIWGMVSEQQYAVQIFVNPFYPISPGD
jgi:Amt family ammonium transporter